MTDPTGASDTRVSRVITVDILRDGNAHALPMGAAQSED